MNIENINILRDTLIRLDKAPLPEHPDKGFNMMWSNFRTKKVRPKSQSDVSPHNCGTAACIAGWCALLFEGDDNGFAAHGHRHIGDFRSLFFPKGLRGNPEKFTLRAAIRVLQILRDTGKVDWNEAIANPWSPEDEAPKTDWLKLMMEPEAPLLIEGPKRVDA